MDHNNKDTEAPSLMLAGHRSEGDSCVAHQSVTRATGEYCSALPE